MDEIINKFKNISLNECSDVDKVLLREFIKLNITEKEISQPASSRLIPYENINSAIDSLVSNMDSMKIDTTEKEIMIVKKNKEILRIPLRCGLAPYEVNPMTKPLPWVEAF